MPKLLILVLVLTALVYTNILGNQFVGDDKTFLFEWNTPNSILNISSLLAGDTPTDHTGVYRPIRGLMYLFMRQVFNTNATAYHGMSLVIHVVATYLVYLVTRKITNKPDLSLITSLLFGLHPIHTESISFLTASFDTLSTVWFFSSIFFYLKFKKNKIRLDYLLSIFFALLSYLTYELTFVLPFLLVLIETTKHKKINWKLLLPYFLGILFYFVLRWAFGIENKGNWLVNPYFTFLTNTKAFWYYITKLILPINLSFVPTLWGNITSFDMVPEAIVKQSITDWSNIAAFLFTLTSFAYVFKHKKLINITSFCLLWIIIGLVPSILNIATGAIVAERYTYIASFGFCLLSAQLLIKIKTKNIFFFWTLVFLVSLFYGFLTIQRNANWFDSKTLWIKTVEQSPRSARAHLSLGIVYANEDNHELARKSFENAIQIYPKYAFAYSAIATTYEKEKNFILALEYYTKALNFNAISKNIFDTARMELALGNKEKALEIINNGLTIHPENKPLHDLNKLIRQL